MSSRLLGLLALSSLGSAMLLPNTTKGSSQQDAGTYQQPNSRTGLMLPLFQPWPGTPDPNLQPLPDFPALIPPIPDTNFCDVFLHSPDISIEQIPPICICSQCKGTTGPKGDAGDRGPSGEPGSPGRRGLTGFKGQRGFTGHQGIKGQKGDEGEKGQVGQAGFTGAKGARGFKGQKGDTGLIGPQGMLGPQGETGSCPASCDSGQGPQGPQGPPGPAGARGLPGVKGVVGPRGFMGSKGDLGGPGDAGLKGEKGYQGEQGVCECTDGMNGTDGRPGEMGSKGDKGDPGTQGAQGHMGSKGDQGISGLNGPPGPCSIAIQSAFSACANQSFPIPDWPVPFPRVLLNQYGHFSPLTGKYNVPYNGTYMFSFHLVVNFRILKVGLFVNYNPVVRITEATNFAIASHSVVLHLSAGDRVWLQVKNNVTNGLYTDTESSSTFSGFLLHPDSCLIPLGRSLWTDENTGTEQYSWDGPALTTPAP